MQHEGQASSIDEHAAADNDPPRRTDSQVGKQQCSSSPEDTAGDTANAAAPAAEPVGASAAQSSGASVSQGVADDLPLATKRATDVAGLGSGQHSQVLAGAWAHATAACHGAVKHG